MKTMIGAGLLQPVGRIERSNHCINAAFAKISSVSAD